MTLRGCGCPGHGLLAPPGRVALALCIAALDFTQLALVARSPGGRCRLALARLRAPARELGLAFDPAGARRFRLARPAGLARRTLLLLLAMPGQPPLLARRCVVAPALLVTAVPGARRSLGPRAVVFLRSVLAQQRPRRHLAILQRPRLAAPAFAHTLQAIVDQYALPAPGLVGAQSRRRFAAFAFDRNQRRACFVGVGRRPA